MPEERTDLDKASPSEDSAALVRPGYPRAAGYPAGYGDPYGYGYPEAGGKINPRELWRTVKKRKWLIVVIAIVATTIVTIANFQTKSIYQASTTVEIEKENRTLVRSGDVIIQTDDGADDAYFVAVNMKTKIRVIQSRPLLEDVVATLDLDKNPRFLDVEGKKTIWEAIRSLGGKIKPQAAPPQSPLAPPPMREVGARSADESARLAPYVSVLANHLTAEPLEETRMLVISYSHTDPALAASIVNAVAQVFIDRSFQNSTEKFTKTSDWLDQMTRKLKANVEESEAAVANYTREHNLFSVDGKETLNTEKLSRLFDQYTRAESDRILKESLYEEVKAGRIDRLPESFSDPRAADLQKRAGELSVQLAQLSVKYGPDNPKVAEVKQELAVIEEQIAGSRTHLEGKLKADYERAVRDERSLKSALDEAKAEAVQQNTANIQFNILKQEVETAKQLYTDFLQKTHQAQVQLAEQHKDMRVIEPAQVPGVPVGPNRLRSIAMGWFLSLVAGVGLAFLLERLDNTIKTVEDVNRYAGLPALGIIPAISSRMPRRLLGGRKQPRPVLAPAEAAREMGAGGGEVQLVALDNRSSAAEAYRGLRTSVLLSSAGGPPKSVMFTSGQPGEGKTTTVINTAISLAQLGSSVLIIDADLRKPGTHKVFGVRHSTGLSTYLSGENVPVDDVIHKLPVQNLYLMPCGPIPPNPAELVSSDKMKEMIQTLGQRFDHILVDSPPLMHVTDPVILSTLVDGVILVIHGGKSTREVVRRARMELSSVGAKVFGVVLNNLDLKREGYDDPYYYYSYYSGYGSGSDGELETN
jgi:capsular exopolysaccharide synthesis family protein